MTARQSLPNRRHAESFIFEVDGLKFTATGLDSPTAASESCSSIITRPAIKATRMLATQPSFCRSRSSTAPTSRRSARRSAVTARAALSVRSPPAWTSSPERGAGNEG